MAYKFGQPAGITPISFAFSSVDVGSGTNYAAGFYKHAGTANDFNPQVTLGTADNAYGANVYLVSAAGDGAGDTTIRITGTSWVPATGTRTGGDTEDLVIAQSEAANTYHGSTKAWIGQVALNKVGGNDVMCNYGFYNTWTHLHVDWMLKGFRATWQGDGNDAGTDVILYHHKSAGWTYHAGAPADPPILYDMQTDYDTEFESNNDEFGVYSRENLSTMVCASCGEGIIAAMIQSGSRPFGIGTMMLGVYNL